MKIAIIIPFYQKQSGLLVRALASVFNQKNIDSPHVILVDDGSPVPARDEIRGLHPGQREAIHLIEQSNGGVSSARNSGLDVIPASADAIAFLDPDDAWHTDHLMNAVIALENGADFYFSDFTRSTWDGTRLSRSGFNEIQHNRMNIGVDLYEYNGGILEDLVFRTIVGTSTVVIKRDMVGHHRFDTSLSSFEDLLFWYQILTDKDRCSVMFSTRVEGFYEMGVGLLSRVEWGSLRSLRVQVDYWHVIDQMSRHPRVPISMLPVLLKHKKNCDRDIASILFHRLKRFQSIDAKRIVRFLVDNPAILIALVSGIKNALFRNR